MSTAPYNFVPFGRVVPASELWGDLQDLHRHQDRRVPGAFSGHIDLELTPLTPLHIGGGDDSGQSEERAGRTLLWPDSSEGVRAWIPGSLLRNTIRSVLDSVLGAPIEVVDKPITFRAPFAGESPKSVLYSDQYWEARGKNNRERAKNLTSERVGVFLTGSRVLVPSTRVKLEWTHLDSPADKGGLGIRDRIGCGLGEIHAQPDADEKIAILRDEFQFKQVYVVESGDRKCRLTTAEDPAGVRHLLLLTGLGRSEGQENAYAVRFPSFREVRDEGIKPLPIPEDVFRAATSRWTDYQEIAIPALPEAGPVPVFFDATGAGDQELVAHIGFSSGFRIKARSTVRSAAENGGATLWPAGSGEYAPCATEALFGTVRQKEKDSGADPYSIASRISFGHALTDVLGADDDQADSAFERRQNVTAVAPKAEAFHTRLQQPNGSLKTYNDGDAKYRGREIYLHRWDAETSTWSAAAEAHRKAGDGIGAGGGEGGAHRGHEYGEPKTDSNRAYRPLKTGGAKFHARVRFTNLSELELGALLFALTLGDPQGTDIVSSFAHAHRLGGLRALGLGSVGIRPTLYLGDLARYTVDWAAPAAAPASPAEVDRLVQAFRAAAVSPSPEGLGMTRQIDALERATRWEGRLPLKETAEMTVKSHALRNPLRKIDDLPWPG